MVGLGLIGTSLIHAECERDTALVDVRISGAKIMHLQLLTLVAPGIFHCISYRPESTHSQVGHWTRGDLFQSVAADK